MAKDKEDTLLLQLASTLQQLDSKTRMMILWVHLKKHLKGNKDNRKWLLKEISKQISEEG